MTYTRVVRVPFTPGSGHPELMADNTIYIIQEDGQDAWVAFLCPAPAHTAASCNCIDESDPDYWLPRVFRLNIIHNGPPKWSLEQHEDGTISLSPSVIRRPCGIHFHLRHNTLEYC